MDYAAKIAGVVALYSLAMISPGPNFVIITRSSISESRQNGLFTGMGVATGSALWATLGSLGLGLLLAQAVWLANGLKIAGGLYLLYLAFKFFRGARKPLDEIKATAHKDTALSTSYRLGLFTNLTNPKSAAFFASLFASAGVVSSETPRWVHATLIASIGALSLTWHAALALVFSSPPFQRGYRRAKTGVDVVCGALLVFMGGRLITSVLVDWFS